MKFARVSRLRIDHGELDLRVIMRRRNEVCHGKFSGRTQLKEDVRHHHRERSRGGSGCTKVHDVDTTMGIVSVGCQNVPIPSLVCN